MGYSIVPTVATGDLWTAANHNTYIKDNFAAHQQMLDGIPLVKISEVVLSSLASEIVFSNIPSTFHHLKLKIFGRTNSINNYVYLQFNGDTGSNYDYGEMSVFSGSHGVLNNINNNKILIGHFSKDSEPVGALGDIEVNIPGYSQQSFFKIVRSFASDYGATVFVLYFIFGGWRSTSAINSIRIIPYDGSFLVGSTFTLYGY